MKVLSFTYCPENGLKEHIIIPKNGEYCIRITGVIREKPRIDIFNIYIHYQNNSWMIPHNSDRNDLNKIVLEWIKDHTIEII